MRAIYSASLAKRGFTGPLRLFEGSNGLVRMFDQPLEVDWGAMILESALNAIEPLLTNQV